MRGIFAVVMVGIVSSPILSAPLPPAVEKINKEGIAVTEGNEAKVQGSLGKEAEGVHLFRLEKGQTYGIDLSSTEFKGRLRIETPDGKPVVSETGKATFQATKDGTYQLKISANGGGAGKYLITVQQFGLAKVNPGVLTVGPGGINLESSLGESDQLDTVRKYKCKVFEVQFQGGMTYTIDMISGQFDSYLRLEDAGHKQLAQDDDGGGYPNARITIQSPANGVFRVITTSFNGGTGNFTLKVRKN